MALREVPATGMESGQEYDRYLEQGAGAECREVSYRRRGPSHLQLAGVREKAEARNQLPSSRVPTLQAAKARGGVPGGQRPGYSEGRREGRHPAQNRPSGYGRASEVHGTGSARSPSTVPQANGLPASPWTQVNARLRSRTDPPSGGDVGITKPAVCSQGAVVANPRALGPALKQPRKLNKAIARSRERPSWGRTQRSSRRLRLYGRRRRLHARIFNCEERRSSQRHNDDSQVGRPGGDRESECKRHDGKPSALAGLG